jgi:hypothetical protein
MRMKDLLKMRSSITLEFVCAIALIGGFIILSGCIAQQKDLFVKPTPNGLSPKMTTGTHSQYERHWIRIDPIKDYETDASFNIIGSSLLIVNGTTDFPVGTQLDFSILQENGSRDLLRTKLQINGNNSGPNSFSYVYDMAGNPPGQYRVWLSDSINFNSDISRFNITSNMPYLKWIQVNPIKAVKHGDVAPISGTTDLPAGSWIGVQPTIYTHSCVTPGIPDTSGKRTLCGGNCYPSEPEQTAQVVEGSAGVNTWNATIEIGDWCTSEKYSIGARAIGWTNVTPGGQSIRFSS